MQMSREHSPLHSHAHSQQISVLCLCASKCQVHFSSAAGGMLTIAPPTLFTAFDSLGYDRWQRHEMHLNNAGILYALWRKNRGNGQNACGHKWCSNTCQTNPQNLSFKRFEYFFKCPWCFFIYILEIKMGWGDLKINRSYELFKIPQIKTEWFCHSGSNLFRLKAFLILVVPSSIQ